MSSLHKFRTALERTMTGQIDSRPFVCSGSPYECKIFIVGFNPATTTSEPFWTFWNDATGFDKERWFKHYKLERSRQPLKPGKTRRAAVSNTRKIIDYIVSEVRPAKVLETNVYGKPTSSERELSASRKTIDVFDFLLSEINPGTILLHGKEARDIFANKYNCHLKLGTFADIFSNPCTINENTVDIIALPHLSRGCSRAAAEAIGQALKIACARDNRHVERLPASESATRLLK